METTIISILGGVIAILCGAWAMDQTTKVAALTRELAALRITVAKIAQKIGVEEENGA